MQVFTGYFTLQQVKPQYMTTELQEIMSVSDVEQIMQTMGYNDFSRCGYDLPPGSIGLHEYQQRWQNVCEEYQLIKSLIEEVKKTQADPAYTPSLPTDTPNRLINYVLRCYKEDKRTPQEVLRFLTVELSDFTEKKIQPLEQLKVIEDPDDYLARARSLVHIRAEAMLVKLRK